MINLLMKYAKSKVTQIAQASGKSEDEVNSAIEKGKQYLPQINNSHDGGIELAHSLGIDRSFAESMYDRFAHIADKIPFFGRAILDKEYNKLIQNLDDHSKPQLNRCQRRAELKNSGGFNRNKYRKV